MQLLTAVEIVGLRSFKKQRFGNTGGLMSLVGKNSSGKSNALRALNLFFNDEVEPGKPLTFSRDYFEQPARRQKKRISVAVSFALPANFKLRKELQHLSALGSVFTIERSWELDKKRHPETEISAHKNGSAVPNGAELAQQFLQLISYRYIPNRSIPVNILKNESQAIADAIFMRMKGDTHAAALLDGLSAAAGRLLGSAQQSMRIAGAPLTEATVATSSTLGEMLSMTGFQATGPHGMPVQDEDWGSGHQSFFLYQVLKALDTNYSRYFGWRQATIWGVEEPESGLHRDLETQLAQKFREWTTDTPVKLQIFQTTHSPVMVMASDLGYWIELAGPESIATQQTIPQLTRAAEAAGVTGWVHPVLSFPWNPIVLVEGKSDVNVLSHVAHLIGLDHIRFLSLPEFDSSERGAGKDSIIGYVKRNTSLIRNRPAEAPLLVLLDWDVSDQDLNKARQGYGADGDIRVLRMNASHCHNLMGPDFKGIERFYPPKIALASHENDECVVGMRRGRPYSISKSELERGKPYLTQRTLRVDKIDDLRPLFLVLQDVQNALLDPNVAQLKMF